MIGGWVTYSGLWPTSTKAACGVFAPVKVLSRVGRAATTSGHQGFFVEGSLEARKATKKALVEAGMARSAAVLGRVKGWRIGMVFFYIFLIFFGAWRVERGVDGGLV
jgi:hypothetical protein